MAEEKKLPHFCAQPDWYEDVRMSRGTFWISVRLPDADQSIHGSVEVAGDALSTEVPFSASLGPAISEGGQRPLSLGTDNSTTRCHFIQPSTSREAKDKPRKIHCIDISPGGGLGVTAHADGGLYIWNMKTGSIERALEGHVGDIFTAKFFPSGEVVLSGGSDYRVKIWSAVNGSNPVTFVGHNGGVLDVHMIGRGRNVLSASRDGTVKLWDCGTARLMATLAHCKGPANTIAVSGAHAHLLKPPAADALHEREAETEGKLLVVGDEAGQLQGIDVRAREQPFTIPAVTTPASAVNKCCFFGEHQIISGCQNGAVVVHDLRHLAKTASYKRSSAPILSLAAIDNTTFVAGAEDGTCFVLDTAEKDMVDLSGPRPQLWTSSDDGRIRGYSLQTVRGLAKS